MNDMEEDHSENVKVLEDERDDARRKEEEYFLELQTRYKIWKAPRQGMLI